MKSETNPGLKQLLIDAICDSQYENSCARITLNASEEVALAVLREIDPFHSEVSIAREIDGTLNVWIDHVENRKGWRLNLRCSEDESSSNTP